jgi:drug/metabolite transporter (DMT)-like permease
MALENTLSRNRKRWFQFLGVAGALLAISIAAGLPAITRAISPALLVAAVLAVAGPLVAVFGGMLRDLGELERRIVSEALALSFIVTISAMFAYPFLEGIGLPPLRPQTVAFVLVASFAVGIARFSRRYQ